MAALLDFSSQSVTEFCDTISAETSAPGGGSVAAVIGAMGASLAAMAARFSKEQWEDAAGAVAQAEALKARLLPMAEEDAQAYESVLLALRMPKVSKPAMMCAVTLAEPEMVMSTGGGAYTGPNAWL